MHLANASGDNSFKESSNWEKYLRYKREKRKKKQKSQLILNKSRNNVKHNYSKIVFTDEKHEKKSLGRSPFTIKIRNAILSYENLIEKCTKMDYSKLTKQSYKRPNKFRIITKKTKRPRKFINKAMKGKPTHQIKRKSFQTTKLQKTVNQFANKLSEVLCKNIETPATKFSTQNNNLSKCILKKFVSQGMFDKKMLEDRHSYNSLMNIANNCAEFMTFVRDTVNRKINTFANPLQRVDITLKRKSQSNIMTTFTEGEANLTNMEPIKIKKKKYRKFRSKHQPLHKSPTYTSIKSVNSKTNYETTKTFSKKSNFHTDLRNLKHIKKYVYAVKLIKTLSTLKYILNEKDTVAETDDIFQFRAEKQNKIEQLVLAIKNILRNVIYNNNLLQLQQLYVKNIEKHITNGGVSNVMDDEIKELIYIVSMRLAKKSLNSIRKSYNTSTTYNNMNISHLQQSIINQFNNYLEREISFTTMKKLNLLKEDLFSFTLATTRDQNHNRNETFVPNQKVKSDTQLNNSLLIRLTKNNPTRIIKSEHSIEDISSNHKSDYCTSVLTQIFNDFSRKDKIFSNNSQEQSKRDYTLNLEELLNFNRMEFSDIEIKQNSELQLKTLFDSTKKRSDTMIDFAQSFKDSNDTCDSKKNNANIYLEHFQNVEKENSVPTEIKLHLKLPLESIAEEVKIPGNCENFNEFSNVHKMNLNNA